MSAGQTGHFHGTNGTRPRDGWGPEVGVSPRISLCYWFFLKVILTTPTPHICRKYAPKCAIQWASVWHTSRLISRDFYRKYGIRTQKYGIRTPLLCHMNRFSWGWGCFNLLISTPLPHQFRQFSEVGRWGPELAVVILGVHLWKPFWASSGAT